jgi:hypothetical protein
MSWLARLLGMEKCIVCRRSPVTIKKIHRNGKVAYACPQHEADAEAIMDILL